MAFDIALATGYTIMYLIEERRFLNWGSISVSENPGTHTSDSEPLSYTESTPKLGKNV